MDVNQVLPLLGGLSPAVFMRRHWQKKPLLVRQAWPGVQPPLPRAALFELAGRDDVESRLVQQRDGRWTVRNGPLPRRALPPASRPGWTLLLQGLDLHDAAAHTMLQAFRFVPEVRLDDFMVSWASAGAGVGPHTDSYDVFLLQLQGRRRWRIAPPARAAQHGQPALVALVAGAPLKLLRDFVPTQEWVLEPGDMLYLPPRWGHEGTAEGGDCMTGSVGFRAPAAGELARELLLRLAEDDPSERLYRDSTQAATACPAAVPAALLDFAREALARHLAEPDALPRALGEVLTEPKPSVWFAASDDGPAGPGAIVLDRRTRMAYDTRHLFINGESFVASGRDARLLRGLADTRRLTQAQRAGLSAGAAELLGEWIQAGWLHAERA